MPLCPPLRLLLSAAGASCSHLPMLELTAEEQVHGADQRDVSSLSGCFCWEKAQMEKKRSCATVASFLELFSEGGGGRWMDGWKREMRRNRCRYGGDEFVPTLQLVQTVGLVLFLDYFW
ncbi:hypothetical protein GOODEAATRI_020470 [Goodea atripinnis]|uniref:Uncharacterized protein n=1 Tax=Goodea atripinnis TaxID=208336 RepID=A0ABV0NLV0_9TELE